MNFLTMLIAFTVCAILVPPMLDAFHYWCADKFGYDFDRKNYRYVKREKK